MGFFQQAGRIGLIAVSLAVAGPLARADDWNGQDKAKHFAVGAAVGLAGIGVQKADDPDRFRNAFLAGAALGALKELRDDSCKCGKSSAKDFMATALGAAAGAGAGLFIFPEKDGVSVHVHKSF